MFGIVGGEARRRPGYSPWTEALVWTVAVLAIVGAAVGGIALTTDWFSGKSAPAVQPFDSTQGKPEQQANTAPGNPPAQSEAGIAAPATHRVVDYQVVWTEVQGFDPSTIPVEEGLYSGISSYSLYPGTNAGDLGPIPARYAYAWGILPQLQGLPVAVAVARYEIDKDIVLTALDADRYGPYILLSVDGEKSWCKLNLLWQGIPWGDATSVRVTLAGDEVHLYGKDARPGNHWWTATASKSALPCS